MLDFNFELIKPFNLLIKKGLIDFHYRRSRFYILHSTIMKIVVGCRSSSSVVSRQSSQSTGQGGNGTFFFVFQWISVFWALQQRCRAAHSEYFSLPSPPPRTSDIHDAPGE